MLWDAQIFKKAEVYLGGLIVAEESNYSSGFFQAGKSVGGSEPIRQEVLSRHLNPPLAQWQI